MWPFSSRKVLIVSEKQREPALDSAFLHQPNIRLLTAHPDADGLKLARTKRPSLIIENLCEPDSQGLEFCLDLRTHPRTRRIPLIVVAEAELHSGIAAIRAEALLTKPLDRREYFEAVRRFVPMPERRSGRTPVNLRFLYRFDGRDAQAFSREISLGGAFIKSDCPPPLDSRLDVEFSLPGRRSPVRTFAIVRSGPMGNGGYGTGGFGIEFDGMKEDDAAQLERFIECCNRHQRS